MSQRSKLEKFAENLTFPNVFENLSYKEPKLMVHYNQFVDYKGSWNATYFKNNQELILELACGGGEYCVGMAQLIPNRNYIGIDIKGARMWKGASQSLNLKLNQVAFVRTRIELLTAFFDHHEVDQIWITFPDPFLNHGKAIKRLTSNYFLDIYSQVLKPGALLHLKTDDPTLYQFSLQSIDAHPKYKIIYTDDDIYDKPLYCPELAIKTHYEKKHLAKGLKIKYICFQYVE